MKNKVIFLDRDGVINHEKNYLYRIEEFSFIDGVFDALKAFQEEGYKLVIVTNQSGIGRGYYTVNDYHKLTAWMLDQFEGQDVMIEKVCFCPHVPDDNCDCRKPEPGMLLDIIKELDVDLENSWIIGDKVTDIEAGINAGIVNGILVRTGHAIPEDIDETIPVLDNLADVVTAIE